MNLDRPFEDRTEQLIAVSRLVLATGGLVAIYLDPDQPTRGESGYWFLVAYLVLAVAILATVRFAADPRWALATLSLIHI